jgi:hypothetical protein
MKEDLADKTIKITEKTLSQKDNESKIPLDSSYNRENHDCWQIRKQDENCLWN